MVTFATGTFMVSCLMMKLFSVIRVQGHWVLLICCLTNGSVQYLCALCICF